LLKIRNFLILYGFYRIISLFYFKKMEHAPIKTEHFNLKTKIKLKKPKQKPQKCIKNQKNY